LAGRALLCVPASFSFRIRSGGAGRVALTGLNFNGRLGGWVSKGGAEGLLCAARDGVGIALKVEDGAQRPLGPALAWFLDQLGLESGGLADAPLTNSRGEVVGSLGVTA